MSNLTFQYVEPSSDVNDITRFITNELEPFLADWWDKRGKEFFDADLDVGYTAFVQMWRCRSLHIIMAYENKEPVGFLLGIAFKPMMFSGRSALQVEAWDADRKDIETGLFNYLDKISPFLGLHEIWISSDVGDLPTVPWQKLNAFTVTRFKR